MRECQPQNAFSRSARRLHVCASQLQVRQLWPRAESPSPRLKRRTRRLFLLQRNGPVHCPLCANVQFPDARIPRHRALWLAFQERGPAVLRTTKRVPLGGSVARAEKEPLSQVGPPWGRAIEGVVRARFGMTTAKIVLPHPQSRRRSSGGKVAGTAWRSARASIDTSDETAVRRTYGSGANRELRHYAGLASAAGTSEVWTTIAGGHSITSPSQSANS